MASRDRGAHGSEPAEGFEAVFRVSSQNGEHSVVGPPEPGRLSAWPSGSPAAMASKSNTTTDHEEIRRWLEEHDGGPASVRDSAFFQARRP